MQLRPVLCQLTFVMGTFLGLLSSQEAEAAGVGRGGGGVTLIGLSGRDASGFDSRVGGVGLEGVRQLGGRFGRGPELRLGGDVALLGGTENGAGFRAGVFGDLVLTEIANADIFVGAGLGVMGGAAMLGPSAAGAGAYFRPELGSQWNLGRMAVVAKLELDVLPGLGENGGPGHYAGINVGLLFGDFPPFDRAQRRAPERRPPPPPTPGRRPGRRTGPPVPPPPRS